MATAIKTIDEHGDMSPQEMRNGLDFRGVSNATGLYDKHSRPEICSEPIEE